MIGYFSIDKLALMHVLCRLEVGQVECKNFCLESRKLIIFIRVNFCVVEKRGLNALCP